MDKFIFFITFDSVNKKTKLLGLTNREGCYFIGLLTILAFYLTSFILQRSYRAEILLFLPIPLLGIFLIKAAYNNDKELIKISYFTYCIFLLPYVISVTFFAALRRRSFLVGALYFPVIGYSIYCLWIIFSFYKELESEDNFKELCVASCSPPKAEEVSEMNNVNLLPPPSGKKEN